MNIERPTSNRNTNIKGEHSMSNLEQAEHQIFNKLVHFISHSKLPHPNIVDQ
jgi:hypothetical protein